MSCETETTFIHTGMYEPYLMWSWPELYRMWDNVIIVTTLIELLQLLSDGTKFSKWSGM